MGGFELKIANFICKPLSSDFTPYTNEFQVAASLKVPDSVNLPILVGKIESTFHENIPLARL